MAQKQTRKGEKGTRVYRKMKKSWWGKLFEQTNKDRKSFVLMQKQINLKRFGKDVLEKAFFKRRFYKITFRKRLSLLKTRVKISGRTNTST